MVDLRARESLLAGYPARGEEGSKFRENWDGGSDIQSSSRWRNVKDRLPIFREKLFIVSWWTRFVRIVDHIKRN